MQSCVELYPIFLIVIKLQWKNLSSVNVSDISQDHKHFLVTILRGIDEACSLGVNRIDIGTSIEHFHKGYIG